MPWLRWYTEGCRDPKVQRLEPAERWLWLAVLSMARESPLPGFLLLSEHEPLTHQDVAAFAGMTLPATRRGITKMLKSGMLGYDPDLRCWYVAAWSERQFESDSSTERSRKFRERRSNVAATSPSVSGSVSGSETTENEEEAIFGCSCVNGMEVQPDGTAKPCEHRRLRAVGDQ